MLAQAAIGAWLSASVLDFAGGQEDEARLLTALGVTAAVPTALAGATDWAEQHEQQMRVGVVHAAGNVLALGLYAASLAGPAAAPGGCGWAAWPWPGPPRTSAATWLTGWPAGSTTPRTSPT